MKFNRRRWIPFLVATAVLSADAEAQTQSPSKGRAVVEMAGLLSLGALWYWVDIDRNLADWDKLSVRQRFSLDSIRLDNNSFSINHVAHPAAGAAYYAFSRANNLSVLTSSAYSILTSLVWEYGLEFQERTSYNDLIVTPGAGIAIGEAFHSLGRYLTRDCSFGLAYKIGQFVGWPSTLHSWLDGESPDCASTRPLVQARGSNAFGLTTQISTSSLRVQGQTYESYSLTLSSRLLDMTPTAPESSQPIWFFDGEWTELTLKVFEGTGSSGAEFLANSILAGFHHQVAFQDFHFASTTGVGFGYHYAVTDQPTWENKLSETHLLGAFHSTQVGKGSFDLELQARVTPDFTASNSLFFSPGVTNSVRGKNVLRKQSYYYGFGWSTEVDLSARYGAILAGVNAAVSVVSSIQGKDRVQEQLETDETLRDTRTRKGAYIKLSLPCNCGFTSYLGFDWQDSRRTSRFDANHLERSWRTFSASISGHM